MRSQINLISRSKCCKTRFQPRTALQHSSAVQHSASLLEMDGKIKMLG